MKFDYKPYRQTVPDDELLSDLKRVFFLCNTDTLTMMQYSTEGKYDCSTILRRFGTWNSALQKLGIHLTQQFWTEEDLFKNLETVWSKKGSQPRRRDMDNKNISNISSGAYLRKFGRWSNALKAFVEFINSEDSLEQESTSNSNMEREESNIHSTKRDINLRLRFKVLQRDNFKCCICGRSPATTPGLKLQVDHIKPWSNGGESVIDNLQTLCSDCNLGKSNLAFNLNVN